MTLTLEEPPQQTWTERRLWLVALAFLATFWATVGVLIAHIAFGVSWHRAAITVAQVVALTVMGLVVRAGLRCRDVW